MDEVRHRIVGVRLNDEELESLIRMSTEAQLTHPAYLRWLLNTAALDAVVQEHAQELATETNTPIGLFGPENQSGTYFALRDAQEPS